MKEKVINLLGIRQKVILCRIDNINGKYNNVYIEPITEEQELRIDNSQKYYNEIRHELKDGTIITSKGIYAYGEINVEDINDINQIKSFNLINSEGGIINSNFNYDKGCSIIKDNVATYYTTWDPIKWFMYCYCLIGKPNRIIIYKCPNFKRK